MSRKARPAGRRREWARSVIGALSVWLLLRTFVVQAFHITSESMEGTRLVGDVLCLARPLYGAEVPFTGRHLPVLQEPRRGDIVIFESVETPGLEVVKRLIGVAGDTLGMRRGRPLRNGLPVEEAYAVHSRPAELDPPQFREAIRRWHEPRLVGPRSTPCHPDRDNWRRLVVPRDSLSMMGDNRDDSGTTASGGSCRDRTCTAPPSSSITVTTPGAGDRSRS